MSSEPAQPIVPTSVEAEAVISAPVVANGSSNETLNEAASTLDALAEASSSALELAVPPAQVEPAAATSSVGAQPAASEDPSSEIASASASLLALGSMTPQEAPKVDTDVEMESKVESEVAEPVAAGAEAEASGSAVALDATSSAAAGSSRLGGSLGRRTSSRSLATTAANAYLEHASDSDDDDDERSVSSVPRKRGRASTGAGSKKSSASGSKRASTSGQSTPKEALGTPLTMAQVRNLSLMKRLRLTRQPNRGPEWRTEHTLFPDSYKESLATPEAKKFLKIFDLKSNILIQRPTPSIENLEHALTILHAASATPDSSPLYKAWIANKYEGEVMLLAGALREQIMRHLTRMKKRGGVSTNKKEAASQEVIDPDADAEGEEEDELISGDELEEEEREEEEKEDEAGPSKKARIEGEVEVEGLVDPVPAVEQEAAPAPAPVEVEQPAPAEVVAPVEVAPVAVEQQ